MTQCDNDDGIEDGIVSSPSTCHFKFARLLCKAEKTDKCLTAFQVQAVEQLYAGPSTLSGEQISSRGVLPGSELGWDDPFLGLRIGPSNAEGLLRFMIYGATPNWKPSEFDFERDYKRLGLAALYVDSNPDLRKFKSAGGKLIAYQGALDVAEVPGAIIDYYETAEKTMGGRESTQGFFRFFLVPGMNHCGGGTGAYAIDYLSHLEAWVERQTPPFGMIAAHVSDTYLAAQPLKIDIPGITTQFKLFIAALNLELPLDPSIPIDFTRPVYPYPLHARYTGKGNPNDAASFRAVGP
jgi:feruloyl esterase